MTVALVIPSYCCDDSDAIMTLETLLRWHDLVDFIVVSEDGGLLDNGIRSIADYYIYHENMGVADSSNIGWMFALENGADYVIICDSDVRPHSGDIKDLCIPGKVAVPLTLGWPERASVAPMMVVPKEVALERGMYDSCGGRHSMKHFDSDYQVRVRDIIEHVTSFEIEHLNGGSQTTGKYMKQCPCGRCDGY